MQKTSEQESENIFVYEVLSRDLGEELLWESKACLQRLSVLCFRWGDIAFMGSPLFVWKSLHLLVCVF